VTHCEDTRAEGVIAPPNPTMDIAAEWPIGNGPFVREHRLVAEAGDIFFAAVLPVGPATSQHRAISISGAVCAQ
jgi:hypothetical protein